MSRTPSHSRKDIPYGNFRTASSRPTSATRPRWRPRFAPLAPLTTSAGGSRASRCSAWWTRTLATDQTSAAARKRVLETFLRDGRIVQIPRQHAKRRVLLDLLAQEFEPGVRYTERAVNEV